MTTDDQGVTPTREGESFDAWHFRDWLNHQTRADLLKYARDRNVPFSVTDTNATIIEAITFGIK